MTIKRSHAPAGEWDVVHPEADLYTICPAEIETPSAKIDEISTGKGHRYVTIVMDLKTGAVVHVGQGKGGDALTLFWKRLRASHARIEAVATDMSPAYIQAVITHLPEATLVFDRVIKLSLSDLTVAAVEGHAPSKASAGCF